MGSEMCIRDSLNYLEDDGSTSDIIYNLINKAAGLFELGQVKAAEEHVVRAVSLADELGDKQLQKLATTSLSSVYQKSGQYQKAYDFLLKSEQIKSELLDEQANVRITELRELYEADKREQDNKLLSIEVASQKNRLKIFGIGIAGLSLLLGLLTWFWRSNKSKNILLEKKNEQIRNQNEKLKELNTIKNNLMSMVSHDLSTPFSAIKVWAQSLSGGSETAEIAETKEAILTLSDQALKSINRVLTIDEKELSDLDLNEFQLSDIFSDVITRHQPIAALKNIIISSMVEPRDFAFLADDSMLTRILDNLVSNAIKYSEENDQIILSAKKNFDSVIIKVQDTGIGISEDVQKILFDRYARGEEAPVGGGTSHGIGLSIVHRLVNELGGLITVDSEKDHGATFTIRLPI